MQPSKEGSRRKLVRKNSEAVTTVSNPIRGATSTRGNGQEDIESHLLAKNNNNKKVAESNQKQQISSSHFEGDTLAAHVNPLRKAEETERTMARGASSKKRLTLLRVRSEACTFTQRSEISREAALEYMNRLHPRRMVGNRRLKYGVWSMSTGHLLEDSPCSRCCCLFQFYFWCGCTRTLKSDLQDFGAGITIYFKYLKW